MARISIVVASGYPYHVTQRGVRFIPVFQTDKDRRAYLDFMAVELDRFGVEVLAWCLMTNYTHLIEWKVCQARQTLAPAQVNNLSETSVPTGSPTTNAPNFSQVNVGVKAERNLACGAY